MPTDEKVDLFKQHKAEYATPKEPALITIKPAKYLTIVGRGRPGDEDFQAKIGALYALAYTIKFAKKAAGRDFKVCTLEGLYWPSGKVDDLFNIPYDQLNWKLMIRVPTFVCSRALKGAAKQLKEKGKVGEFDKVELETIKEGRCVQMLHVGPYDQERPTIERMQAYAEAEGLTLGGPHHEIYLSDPRRVPPARLRTILRLPIG